MVREGWKKAEGQASSLVCVLSGGQDLLKSLEWISGYWGAREKSGSYLEEKLGQSLSMSWSF